MTFVELSRSDVPRIHALYMRVINSLPDPGAVRPDEPTFFDGIFDVGGEILGLFLADRLISYGVLRPSLERENDRRGTEHDVPADASLMVLDGSAVDPDYWRQGLQRTVIGRRVERAKELGAQHVIALAGPRNIPSMRNLTKSGFVTVGLSRKTYGWRYVHHRHVDSVTATSGIGTWMEASAVERAEQRFRDDEVGTLAMGDPQRGPVIRYEHRL